MECVGRFSAHFSGCPLCCLLTWVWLLGGAGMSLHAGHPSSMMAPAGPSPGSRGAHRSGDKGGQSAANDARQLTESYSSLTDTSRKGRLTAVDLAGAAAVLMGIQGKAAAHGVQGDGASRHGGAGDAGRSSKRKLDSDGGEGVPKRSRGVAAMQGANPALDFSGLEHVCEFLCEVTLHTMRWGGLMVLMKQLGPSSADVPLLKLVVAMMDPVPMAKLLDLIMNAWSAVGQVSRQSAHVAAGMEHSVMVSLVFMVGGPCPAGMSAGAIAGLD